MIYNIRYIHNIYACNIYEGERTCNDLLRTHSYLALFVCTIDMGRDGNGDKA